MNRGCFKLYQIERGSIMVLFVFKMYQKVQLYQLWISQKNLYKAQMEF